MAAIGSGLGSAGFIVFDDTADMVAVAAGAARFLAVESCGQCVPCKWDGLALAELLARVCRSKASAHDMEIVRRRLLTVTDRSRCYLATQQQNIIGSLLDCFRKEFVAHLEGRAAPCEPELVSLQIQEIDDPSGYIQNLGRPHAAVVASQARIAQAHADREATENEQAAEALKAQARRDSQIK